MVGCGSAAAHCASTDPDAARSGRAARWGVVGSAPSPLSGLGQARGAWPRSGRLEAVAWCPRSPLPAAGRTCLCVCRVRHTVTRFLSSVSVPLRIRGFLREDNGVDSKELTPGHLQTWPQLHAPHGQVGGLLRLLNQPWGVNVRGRRHPPTIFLAGSGKSPPPRPHGGATCSPRTRRARQYLEACRVGHHRALEPLCPSVAQAPSSPLGSPAQWISGLHYLAFLCSSRPFCGHPGVLGLSVCGLLGWGSFGACSCPGYALSICPCCSGACAHPSGPPGGHLRTCSVPSVPADVSVVPVVFLNCPPSCPALWSGLGFSAQCGGNAGLPRGRATERLLTTGWPWSFPFSKCASSPFSHWVSVSSSY